MSATETLQDRQVRATQNQSLFRHVNERILSLNEAFSVMLPHGDFACECAAPECIERIEMTVEEYEAVRRVAARFAVKPGHVLPDGERVVAENGRFTVVEKFGAGLAVAVQTDPRR